MSSQDNLSLFGGNVPWDFSEWTSSDDGVRGGKSQSYLSSTQPDAALFSGNLDIETLGGAGFASQRTATDTYIWDLSQYDGIELILHPIASDLKKYNFILKDTILPPDPNTGREQSTISYEAEFQFDENEGKQLITRRRFQFKDNFKAFYRGREVPDAAPLSLASIKRFSIMMRSNFGEQQGPFQLVIQSVSAFKSAPAAPSLVSRFYSAGSTKLFRYQKSSLATHFWSQRNQHLVRSKSAVHLLPTVALKPSKYHTFPSPHSAEDLRVMDERTWRAALAVNCHAVVVVIGLFCCVPILLLCLQSLHDLVDERG